MQLFIISGGNLYTGQVCLNRKPNYPLQSVELPKRAIDTALDQSRKTDLKC